MTRRDFLHQSSTMLSLAMIPEAIIPESLQAMGHPAPIDIRTFHQSRRFADLPMSRVAYIERGRGPAALLLHGFPLNGYQWRGALDRLSPYRRCIAADFMGLGYTETPEGQDISLPAQADMLAALLDHLKIRDVDLVANDSGGLIAQLFIARHPERVRSLLITNCDVDENSPPDAFKPLIHLAKQPGVADKFIAPQLADKTFARSDKGLGVAYTHPAELADDTIDCYFAPLVSSPLRKEQFSQYLLDFDGNPLVPIREKLREFSKPARIVWATNDIFFGVQWAEWLDRTLPGSRGIRRIDGAKLFFPEEMPDIIAEEAMTLWGVAPRSAA